MDDIRFIEVEGDFLVLEATGGQRFRLIADEDLRSALKREKPARLDAISMTPREIQDAVRDGESVESIVARSGATFEFVEKFAAPVIAELAHIIESALTVRLGIQVDSDHGTAEFGEIMTSRIRALGASNIAWSAKRTDLGIWHLAAEYSSSSGTFKPVWSFDPRRLTLSPENEAAAKLNNDDAAVATSTPAAFAPKLTVVEGNQDLPSDPAELKVEDGIAPSYQTTEVLNEIPSKSATKRPTMPAPAEPLSATADLLEALRRKRTERSESTTVVEESPPEEPTETVLEAAEESTPAKKGRASMPSWDEIVFGTKAED